MGQHMRTTIDLPESQLTALRELEQRKHISRAELIRQAITQYLAHHAKTENAFGAWKTQKSRAAGGLTAQRKLRAEWGQ